MCTYIYVYSNTICICTLICTDVLYIHTGDILIYTNTLLKHINNIQYTLLINMHMYIIISHSNLSQNLLSVPETDKLIRNAEYVLQPS